MNRWFIFYDDISKKDVAICLDKILYITKNEKDCEIYDINNNVFSCSSAEDIEDLFDMMSTVNI